MPAIPLFSPLGEIIWLIPVHCDPTVTLHDEFMVGVDEFKKGGGVETGIVETIFKKVDATCRDSNRRGVPFDIIGHYSSLIMKIEGGYLLIAIS